MAVQAESETSFKQYKNTQNRRSERIGKLTKHTKSSTIQKFGKNKETKQKKYLKIGDDQIKEFLQAKIWLALKKLEYKTTHQRTQQ